MAEAQKDQKGQEIETEFDNAVDSIRELDRFLSSREYTKISGNSEAITLSGLAIARSIIALATTVDVRGRETIEAIDKLSRTITIKS
ncbi:MAG: hypothetical protein UT53_C0002G0023 [Candidatus Yanofskybacteria bacterium GW2011_GWD2_39_48]|uniref:Uncharacterized protein n=1 Tax=Candidatus Yanofskybacteria bacterium GW2011_GWD2_39_48 TaxID=1619031 RepID=A0A0G0RN71_9BACT|nr:MAG: hypothetical protein UT53_C0002G0023 [Candidatus Yanofskybacteria bacterium GW2011_GWD2_39_48]